MFEQFGPLYWQLPVNIENPYNTTYQRLYRSLTDGLFYLRNHDGTEELFSSAIGAVGAMHFVGGVDLSGGLFPTVGSGPTSPTGSVAAGDTFAVTTGGTVCGTVLNVGDLIIAEVANPGQTCANWTLLEMAGAYVPYTGANATVDLNTQTLIAGLLRLGDPAGSSILELNNNTTGSQLLIKDSGAGFNTVELQLGTTGSLAEFHFSAPAWSVDKNLRFDKADDSAAQIYTNNSSNGIGINGANDISGNFGIFIQGNGVLQLATNTKGIDTLVAGTVTIATTKVTATSKIMLTVKGSLVAGVAVGVPYVESVNAGVGFTINSNDLLGNLVATDVREVMWTIVE